MFFKINYCFATVICAFGIIPVISQDDDFGASLEALADEGYSKLPKTTESFLNAIVDDIMEPVEDMEEVIEDGAESLLNRLKDILKEWFYVTILLFVIVFTIICICKGICGWCKRRRTERQLNRVVSDIVERNVLRGQEETSF